jgi:hypothetical protein
MIIGHLINSHFFNIMNFLLLIRDRIKIKLYVHFQKNVMETYIYIWNFTVITKKN